MVVSGLLTVFITLTEVPSFREHVVKNERHVTPGE